MAINVGDTVEVTYDGVVVSIHDGKALVRENGRLNSYRYVPVDDIEETEDWEPGDVVVDPNGHTYEFASLNGASWFAMGQGSLDQVGFDFPSRPLRLLIRDGLLINNTD